MSEPTSSTLLPAINSQSSSANDPLRLLMHPKALHEMTQDEIRVEVNALRQLRVGSSHSLGRALRENAAVAKSKESKKPQKEQSLDDLLGGL